MTKDTIIRARVPDVMADKIDAEAERRGKTRSSMIRYIIDLFFDYLDDSGIHSDNGENHP